MNMNIPEKYLNGEYLNNNPNWFIEDSQWKANQILKIIQRNKLSPKSICEVGCGAGEILRQLQNLLDENCYFYGYEISPQAYMICKKKENERLNFYLTDFLCENSNFFDISLSIDVIEHLEDYFTYLRYIKERSEYKIFHIPLEFFALSAIHKNFIINQRVISGHLHFFTKDIIIQTLIELNYDVIDFFYTPGYSLGHNYGLKDKIINIPRKYLYYLNSDLTIRLLGGYSLMILAK